MSASVSRKAGGLFDANRRVAQELINLGDCVEAFGISDDRWAMDKADWLPVPANVSNSFGPSKLGYSLKLSAMIRDFSPDVLHSHGLWLGTSAHARTWGKKTRRPVIVHPHGMMDPWALRNSAWKKQLSGWLFEFNNLRHATCIRALCDSEAQSIRRFGLKNPIAIIPNGIDLPRNIDEKKVRGEGVSLSADSCLPSDDDTALKICVSERSKTLLYLGRIHPKKGLANLLRAWSDVVKIYRHSNEKQNKSQIPWKLWIAGWDEVGHETQLKQLATDLALDWCDVRDDISHNDSASVLFLGPQFKNRKSWCYKNCDAFVLPSYSEGLPMVVLEAWAYSKPVLMTPHCNLPEGFQTKSAIRVETTVESVREGLYQVMTLPDEDRILMGNRGRALVRQKFTWSEVAKQVHDLSRWAIHGGTPPEFVRFD